ARGAATPGRLHLYRQLAAYDLIRAGSRFSRILARRLLGGIADDPKALVTVREFCRKGYNVKLTAAALGIHPHTLTYRLAGMRTHLGLDLVSPEGRLATHLALLAHEVEGLAPAEESSSTKLRS
ncbi:MAG: helix-turn-helix domain-containing protein, partial [Candidatus Binatia bacterium]